MMIELYRTVICELHDAMHCCVLFCRSFELPPAFAGSVVSEGDFKRSYVDPVLERSKTNAIQIILFIQEKVCVCTPVF